MQIFLDINGIFSPKLNQFIMIYLLIGQYLPKAICNLKK